MGALCCAYTGEPLEIVRIPDTPLYKVIGGFAPAEWISGIHFDRLKKDLMRRPGGKWVRKMKCPYKGTEVTVEEHLGMVRAVGAFSPASVHWLSYQEALWECSWRDGKEPDFPRELRIEVGDVRMETSDPMVGYGSTTEKIANDTVEHMLGK